MGTSWLRWLLCQKILLVDCLLFRGAYEENWKFGGGKLSLEGKAHNFVGGAEMRTLYVNLKK
jgi:hypothetical protein